MSMNSRITNQSTEMKNFGADVTLTVSNAVVSFSATQLPAQRKYVLLQVQDQPVRLTYDGGDPTTTAGQRRVAGEETILLRDTVLAMKFIREGGTDAKIWAQPLDLT